MAWSIVQGTVSIKIPTAPVDTTTGATLTLSSTPTEGNELVAYAIARPANATTSTNVLSMSGWTKMRQEDTTSHSIAVFHKTAGASESTSHTLTATMTGDTDMSAGLYIMEVSGGTFGTADINEGSSTTSSVASYSDTFTPPSTAARFVVGWGTIRQTASSRDLTWDSTNKPTNDPYGSEIGTTNWIARAGWEEITSTATRTWEVDLDASSAQAAMIIVGWPEAAGDDHTLVTQDISHSLTEDTTTISQNHVISSDDIAFSLTEDNGTIGQNHIISPQDIEHGLTVDAATINQNHVLSSQDIEHGSTIDNTTVDETVTSLTLSTDFIDITFSGGDTYTLLTNDIEHGLTLDNATINQNHIIGTDDIAFSLTEDGTTVEETNFNLTTQDIEHGLTVDTTTISQNHVVASNDIEHGLTLDNTTLDQSQILASQDIELGLTADATTITQNHVISTDDIGFSTTVDDGSISQNHVVDTQDIELGSSIDATTINQTHILASSDIEHATTIDATTISQNHVLTPADLALALTADNTTLSQVHVLASQDMLISLTIDNGSIDTGEPQARKYYIDIDSGNIYWVVNQDSGYVVKV